MIGLPEDAHGAVAVGWATVELDRAARELSHLLVAGSEFSTAASSLILGARCRVGSAAAPAAVASGLRIVLLEPDTEGRLAAILARSGEGWAATWWLRPAAGDALSTARPGPLGEERLLLGGPATGRHRLVVDAVPSPR